MVYGQTELMRGIPRPRTGASDLTRHVGRDRAKVIHPADLDIEKMSLKTVNLNLVPVLRALLRTRSVTETGRVLGRSPSAISEGLAQLRHLFNDPLLVRAQGGMTLTPRATTLIDPVELLYANAERVFESALADPIETPRLITIAAHDYHMLTVGPRLERLLQAVAPMITLRFVDLSREIGQQMTERDVDFALMPDFYVELLARARLEHAPVGVDTMAILMREQHPLARKKRISREDLSAHGHVVFQPTWEPAGQRQAFASTTRNLPIRVRVSQISALPQFVAETDLIAMVPLGLATLLGPPLGLVHRPPAFDMPTVQVSLCWSPVQGADAGHRWFREQVLAELIKN